MFVHEGFFKDERISESSY